MFSQNLSVESQGTKQLSQVMNDLRTWFEKTLREGDLDQVLSGAGTVWNWAVSRWETHPAPEGGM